MDAPNVVPADWIRGWIGMLDARRPGWRRDYDSEAFEPVSYTHLTLPTNREV